MTIHFMKKSATFMIIVLLIFACDKNPFDSKDNKNVVKIPDPVVEKAIRDALNKPGGDIEISDLKKIQSLFIEGQAKTLDGIEYCTEMTDLGIGYSKIKDLEQIKKLTNLQNLYLNYNMILDISALRDLQRLKMLYLSHNIISDITPIANLDSIKILVLSYNNISSIPNLKNMKQLEIAAFKMNHLTTIEPFLNLPCLVNLNLQNNDIRDLSIIYNAVWLNTGKMNSINLESNPLDDNSIENIISDLRDKYYINIVY